MNNTGEINILNKYAKGGQNNRLQNHPPSPIPQPDTKEDKKNPNTIKATEPPKPQNISSFFTYLKI